MDDVYDEQGRRIYTLSVTVPPMSRGRRARIGDVLTQTRTLTMIDRSLSLIGYISGTVIALTHVVTLCYLNAMSLAL